MKKFVVFDIDGTLADNAWRVPLMKTDYLQYVSLMVRDEPISPVVELCEFYIARGTYDVVFLTGRKADQRILTRQWLSTHVEGSDTLPLIMRPLNVEPFKVPDEVLKIQLMKDLVDGMWNKVHVVFEDRNSVVKAWRDIGVRCIQPQDGDF